MTSKGRLGGPSVALAADCSQQQQKKKRHEEKVSKILYLMESCLAFLFVNPASCTHHHRFQHQGIYVYLVRDISNRKLVYVFVFYICGILLPFLAPDHSS